MEHGSAGCRGADWRLIVFIFACAFFSTFTGTLGVTVVPLGARLFPALMQAGYKENVNLGLITTLGSLGLFFAPSLPLIR